MSRPDFSDEDLTAFLDGEASPDLEAAIAEAVEMDDALADRLAGLDLPLATLRAEYDALLDDAPPMPALPTAQAPRRPMIGLGLFGGGLAAGLAIAALTGLFSTAPKTPEWKTVVADYQLLYGPETLEGLAPNASEAQAQLLRAGQAIDLDLSGLPTPEGLTFRRAQLLAFENRPLVQIAFTRADGTPLALCILPRSDEVTSGFDMETLQGLMSASWHTPSHGYILIGKEPADQLRSPAQAFEAWSRS